MAVQVTAQLQPASFSEISHASLVQISLAWADTLHGNSRISAA